MPKYTEVPWSIVPYSRWDKEILIDGKTEHGNLIAVIPYDDCDDEEQEGNAKLIELAPEMYEALESIQEAWPVVRQMLMDSEWVATSMRWIEALDEVDRIIEEVENES